MRYVVWRWIVWGVPCVHVVRGMAVDGVMSGVYCVRVLSTGRGAHSRKHQLLKLVPRNIGLVLEPLAVTPDHG